MKYPCMDFAVDEWLSDPALSICSAATRGIWVDLLCAMHKLDRCGVIAGSREQLARLGRCSAVELAHALDELKTTNTANVTERDGVVSLTNRRMQREARERNANKLRMQRSRACGACAPPGAAGVTTPLSLIRDKRQSFEPLSEGHPVPGLAPDHGDARKANGEKGDQALSDSWAIKAGEATKAKKLPPRVREAVERFENALAAQWLNDAGKWVNRCKEECGKAERAVAEVESAIREGRVRTTPAQYAEQIWKEFA